MKRHPFTCATLLSLLLTAACVPTNTSVPSNSSQLYTLSGT